MRLPRRRHQLASRHIPQWLHPGPPLVRHGAESTAPLANPVATNADELAQAPTTATPGHQLQRHRLALLPHLLRHYPPDAMRHRRSVFNLPGHAVAREVDIPLKTPMANAFTRDAPFAGQIGQSVASFRRRSGGLFQDVPQRAPLLLLDAVHPQRLPRGTHGLLPTLATGNAPVHCHHGDVVHANALLFTQLRDTAFAWRSDRSRFHATRRDGLNVSIFRITVFWLHPSSRAIWRVE